MLRPSTAVLMLAFATLFAAACGSVEKAPEGGGGGKANGTAAERALAAHHDELMATPGVVAASLNRERDAIQLTVCANEVVHSIDQAKLGAPIVTTLASGNAAKDCGCVSAGHYYAQGESYKNDCNTCRCKGPDQATCTLLACTVEISATVPFAKDRDDLDAAGRAVVGDVAQTLANNPQLRLKLIGHSAAGEGKGVQLSMRRAQAVRDALMKAGIDKVRLQIEGAGTSRPDRPSGSLPRVSFEILDAP